VIYDEEAGDPIAGVVGRRRSLVFGPSRSAVCERGSEPRTARAARRPVWREAPARALGHDPGWQAIPLAGGGATRAVQGV